MFAQVCLVFYFSVSKLIVSCLILQYLFNWKLGSVFFFFSLLSMKFFVGLENDLVILYLYIIAI